MINDCVIVKLMLSQKGFSSLILLVGVVLVVGLSIGGLVFNANFLNKQSGKPDLIIENVTFKKDTSIMSDKYGMPIPSSGDGYIFTLTIKNIGTKDFNDSFYLLQSTSNYDLEINHYSSGKLVNANKQKIPAGGSITITENGNLEPGTTKVRFLINQNSEAKEEPALAVHDELNFTNNGYELQLIKDQTEVTTLGLDKQITFNIPNGWKKEVKMNDLIITSPDYEQIASNSWPGLRISTGKTNYPVTYEKRYEEIYSIVNNPSPDGAPYQNLKKVTIAGYKALSYDYLFEGNMNYHELWNGNDVWQVVITSSNGVATTKYKSEINSILSSIKFPAY